MDRGDFWVRKFSNRGFYRHVFFRYFYRFINIYGIDYCPMDFGDFLVRKFRTLGIFWFENGSKIGFASQFFSAFFNKSNPYWLQQSA